MPSYTPTSGNTTNTGRIVLGYKQGTFMLSVWGFTSATYAIERSYDGVTWLNCTTAAGTANSFTIPTSQRISEIEGGVQYAINVTALTGTLQYRSSQ